MKRLLLLSLPAPFAQVAFCLLLLTTPLHAADAPQRYDLAKRASEIDPRAKGHPEVKWGGFAMHQKVDRVVMFSGPRDNTQTWQGGASATPSDRFFGFTYVLGGGWAGDPLLPLLAVT
ncbi:MAG: hypothetical protein WED15_09140 [Akkermansiaceae bacterium]